MLDSFARLGLAFMTLWPPNQAPGALTDAGALARGSQRPTNAFEAFRRSWEEVRFDLLARLTSWHIGDLSATRSYGSGHAHTRQPVHYYFRCYCEG